MPNTRWCPPAQLVKIPDGVDFQTRRRGHAPGHDRALPDALHLSAQEGRHLPGARRGGRRRRADRADGQDARARASSAPFRRTRRPRIAREAGADEVIHYTKQDFEAEVKRLTGGRGVDVIYDSVGAATFMKGLERSLRPRGPDGAVRPIERPGAAASTRPS